MGWQRNYVFTAKIEIRLPPHQEGVPVTFIKGSWRATARNKVLRILSKAELEGKITRFELDMGELR